MKTFGYTYRDKTGALKNGSLQAPDRIDALRQIKERGCIPVAITEGKSTVAGKRTPWNNAARVAAAAGVLLIVALAVWLTTRQETGPRRLPAPVLAPKSVAPIPLAAGPEPAVPPPAYAAVHPELAVQPDVAPPPTAGVAPGTPQPPPAAAKKPFETPAPETVVEPTKPTRPSAYNTTTEALLSMAMSVPPGAMIPPMPITPGLEADFAKSLTNDIVVFDDDDERMIEHKKKVALAKLALLEQVNQGRSVSEVLKEYQESTNERAAARSDAQRELAELLKNGKPDRAEAYLEEVNKAFTELGIEPIVMPRTKAR